MAIYSDFESDSGNSGSYFNMDDIYGDNSTEENDDVVPEMAHAFSKNAIGHFSWINQSTTSRLFSDKNRGGKNTVRNGKLRCLVYFLAVSAIVALLVTTFSGKKKDNNKIPFGSEDYELLGKNYTNAKTSPCSQKTAIWASAGSILALALAAIPFIICSCCGDDDDDMMCGRCCGDDTNSLDGTIQNPDDNPAKNPIADDQHTETDSDQSQLREDGESDSTPDTTNPFSGKNNAFYADESASDNGSTATEDMGGDMKEVDWTKRIELPAPLELIQKVKTELPTTGFALKVAIHQALRRKTKPNNAHLLQLTMSSKVLHNDDVISKHDFFKKNGPDSGSTKIYVADLRATNMIPNDPKYTGEHGVNTYPEFARAPLDDGVNPFHQIENVNVHINLVSKNGEDRSSKIRAKNTDSEEIINQTICGDTTLPITERVMHFRKQITDPRREALILRAGASLIRKTNNSPGSIDFRSFQDTVQEPLFSFELDLQKIMRMFSELKIFGAFDDAIEESTLMQFEEEMEEKLQEHQREKKDSIARKNGKKNSTTRKNCSNKTRDFKRDKKHSKHDDSQKRNSRKQRKVNRGSKKARSRSGDTADENSRLNKFNPFIKKHPFLRKERVANNAFTAQLHLLLCFDRGNTETNHVKSSDPDWKPVFTAGSTKTPVVFSVFKKATAIIDRYNRMIKNKTFTKFLETQKRRNKKERKDLEEKHKTMIARSVRDRNPELSSRGFIYYRSRLTGMHEMFKSSSETADSPLRSAGSFINETKTLFTHRDGYQKGQGEYLCFGLEFTALEDEDQIKFSIPDFDSGSSYTAGMDYNTGVHISDTEESCGFSEDASASTSGAPSGSSSTSASEDCGSEELTVDETISARKSPTSGKLIDNRTPSHVLKIHHLRLSWLLLNGPILGLVHYMRNGGEGAMSDEMKKTRNSNRDHHLFGLLNEVELAEIEKTADRSNKVISERRERFSEGSPVVNTIHEIGPLGEISREYDGFPLSVYGEVPGNFDSKFDQTNDVEKHHSKKGKKYYKDNKGEVVSGFVPNNPSGFSHPTPTNRPPLAPVRPVVEMFRNNNSTVQSFFPAILSPLFIRDHEMRMNHGIVQIFRYVFKKHDVFTNFSYFFLQKFFSKRCPYIEKFELFRRLTRRH